ncbi:MAG: cysteine peptidase family C39 domain-containing protein, partial [Kofleriaceae bacterium]
MSRPSFPGFSRPDLELSSELDDATNLLAVDDPGATLQEAIVGMLRVCVAGGRSSDYPLSRGVLVLGRSPDVDIQLKHKSVSRRHLELRIEGEQIIATDLGSTAGTFVDGNRISAPTQLSLGGSLALGEQRIEIHALHATPSPASLAHTLDIQRQHTLPGVVMDTLPGVVMDTLPGVVMTTLPGVVIPPRPGAPAPPPPRPTIPTTAPTFDELALAARSPAFAELQSADRDSLLGLIQRLDVQGGQVVLAPGQALDFVLVVVSGQLQVYDGGHSIAAIGPGECVELLQLVRAEPSRVEVRADAPVRILWLDAVLLRAVLARDTASAQLLVRCLEWPGAARFRLLLHHYGVDRESAVQLIGSLNLRSVAAGSELARENTYATTLQIVTRGIVNATRLIDGTPMPLSELREGTMFGGTEISLEKPYSLSYTAATDVELLVIERRHVIDALHRAPELSTLLDAFAPNRPPPAAQPDAVDQPDDDDDPEAPPVSTFKKKGGAKLLRRPRPVLVRQHDKMDCGAACLATVSLAYGRRLSLAHFRAQVHVTREGASMWSLVRVARHTGFEVVGVQCALQGLKNLQLPAIALLQYHYVVIYEIKDTYVLCGDPGGGLVRVPID